MKNIFKHLNKCLETFISSHFNFMLFSQFPLMTLKVVLPRDDQEREKQIPYANTYIWNLKKKNGSDERKGRTGIKTQM